MKKIIFICFVLMLTLKAQDEPTDTDGNGYRNIATLSNLQWVCENDWAWDENFELDNDINAAATENWYTGLGWIPLGSYETPFEGNFNGNGYSLDSIYINRPGREGVGFFGTVEPEHYNVIENLRITNCNITGDEYVAALVGECDYSTIEGCYVSGDIFANYDSGGMVGYGYNVNVFNCESEANIHGSSGSGGIMYRSQDCNIVNSSYNGTIDNGSDNNTAGGILGYSRITNIINCVASGNISGQDYIGGIIGYVYYHGVMHNCLSYAEVSGRDSVGGLIGYFRIEPDDINNCFWDIDASGTSRSNGGIGKNTSELQTMSTYTNAGWNFEFIWDIDSGYPYIELDESYRPTDTDNNGYINIQTLDELRWLSESRKDLHKNFELDNDIDASPTQNWNDGRGWIPIGLYEDFHGSFNGNGYVISNLYSYDFDHDEAGFFASIEGDSPVIENLGLENCDISSDRYVGGIAGSLDDSGLIRYCYTSGKILGIMYVGGIVGSTGGTIQESYSECKVDGFVSYEKFIGGFVGKNNGTIENCYSRGNVTGDEDVGGFIGYNYSANVKNCYSTGTVQGPSSDIGGFTAANPYGTIDASFWDTTSSNIDFSSGAIPRNTLQMQYDTTYSNHNWDLDSIWSMDMSINDGYPYLNALDYTSDNISKIIDINVLYDGLDINSIQKEISITIELRQGTTLMSSSIISSKSGILDTTGRIQLDFGDVTDGDYWILLRSTGFLPVCTPQKLTLSENGISYDFTTSYSTSVLGQYAMKENNGAYYVRSGDFDMDGAVGSYDINRMVPNIGKSVKSQIPPLDTFSFESNPYSEEKLVDLTVYYSGFYGSNKQEPIDVLVELRSGNDLMNSQVVSRKTQNLDSNGNLSLDFGDVADGDYWILVRTTGFLPLCTPQKHSLSNSGITYDFTSSSSQSILGDYSMKQVNSHWEVLPGDIDSDGAIGAYDVNALIPNIGKSVKSGIPVE